MQTEKKRLNIISVVVVTLFCCYLLTVAPQTSATEIQMNFHEVLSYALENSNEIKIAHHKNESSKSDFERSKSAFYPEIALSLSQGLEEQKRQGTGYFSDSPSSPWTSQLILSGKQNIYNNGEEKSRYEINKAKLSISEKELDGAREELLLKISQYYFQFSLLQKNLEIKTMTHQLLLKQFTYITGQYQEGHKTKIDYLRFKSKVEQGRMELKSLATDLDNVIISIKKQMGMKLDEKIHFLPAGELISSSLDTRLFGATQFEGQRVEMVSKEKIKISDLEFNLVKRRNWPILNLETNLNYGVSDYLSSKESFHKNYGINYSVMVKLTYNIFDGGRTTQEILNQKHQQALVQIDYQDKKRDWIEKNIHITNDLKMLQENVSLHRELVKLEDLSFQTVQDDYRTGKVAFLDYMNALTNLTDSKLNYYKNIFELNKTILDFYYQQGTLYENIYKK